jgi:hypothetical protein
MKKEELVRAVDLGQKIGHIFVATADAQGQPHLAAAGKLALISDAAHVTVEAWFCPGTVANLEVNRHVSLVIWDARPDQGYQLLGEAEKVEEIAMMNGYAPGEEGKTTLPQVERRLLIRVSKILTFRHAPHSDEEE